MNNSNLEKPAKSLIWIVATIWANIFIVSLILGMTWIFLRILLVQLFSPLVVVIFLILFFVGGIIYAIKLGIKSVLKKSVIKKERIFQISFWVVLVYLFLTSIFLFFRDVLLQAGAFGDLDLSVIFLSSLAYFSITYYWCKKLIK